MDYLLLKRSALLVLAGLALPLAVHATQATRAARPPLPTEPLLRCEVTYAGTTTTVEARPVADPYPVASIDIGGRFRFKAVVVGRGTVLDYIKLYAYLDAKRQPILIQQATYLPPFQPTQTPYLLTGEQHLYGGPVERELVYHCTLQGVQP